MPDEIDLNTFNELKQISGADFINELIDTFLDDTPKLIAQMKTALPANDADGFRRAAHSLKSNSATFGAMRLSGLAKELEMLGKQGKLGQAGKQLEALEQAYLSSANELKGLK